MPRVLLIFCATFIVGSIFAQSPARSTASSFSVEAKLDALAKKLDEQNTKIDLLSQQILKLQQQAGGDARPGVMIGEGAPSSAESITATSTSTPITSASPAGGTSHIVARGETLTSIAKAYNVSVTELQNYNHIENPLKLQAGQTLMIPPSPSAAPSSSGE